MWYVHSSKTDICKSYSSWELAVAGLIWMIISETGKPFYQHIPRDNKVFHVDGHEYTLAYYTIS